MVMGLWAALGCFLAGCEDPAARAHLERREQNLDKTARMFWSIEEAEPRAMSIVVDAAREQHEKDLHESAANPGRIGALIEEDFARFRDRQPLYRQGLEDRLRGRPENISRTWPDIIY